MHVFKGNLSLDIRMSVRIKDFNRLCGFPDLFLFCQKLKHTLSRSSCRLQDIHRLRNLRNRVVEVSYIDDEGLDISDFDDAVHRQPASQNTHTDIADISDKHGNRLHQAA